MPGDFHWYLQGLQIASKHQLAEISTRLITLRHSATGPHGPTLPVVRPLEGCWKSATGPGDHQGQSLDEDGGNQTFQNYLCLFQPFGNVTISHIAMERGPFIDVFLMIYLLKHMKNGDFPIATLNYHFGGYLVCNAADKGPQKECMRCSDFQREF